MSTSWTMAARMRQIWLATAMMAFALPASAQTGVPTREENWQRCMDAEPDRSIAGCTTVIQSGREQPQDLAFAFANRALAWIAKAEPEKAIADLDRAIQLDPEDGDSYSNRGRARLLKGDADARTIDRALADHDRAIKLKPYDLRFYDRRGLAFVAKGEFVRAIEDFDLACELEPDEAEFLANRGFARLRQGQLEAARRDYDAALKLDPKHPEALFGRGVARRRAGDRAGGDADIVAAMGIDSGIASAMAKKGVQP